ncbi:MAG TPA: MerR family transcriptional regulator [Gemmatimonadaceae bacterium]|nr:MerR family transcriptional regulator [Gemmatimonadaceae bacterium]
MEASPAADSIPKHPIGVVAQRTGLSQDVIRVWERRYGAVQPGRGSGGHRLYADRDIERLRLLNAATRAGRSISQVAHLPLEALSALVEQDAAAQRVHEPSPPAPEAELFVDSALDHARALDGQQLDEMLRRAAALLGISTFVEHVAVPILRRVGDEWHAGRLTPAHEHLASTVVHDIVADTMRAFVPGNGAARLVVATPAGERHVIGATLAGVTAALEGWSVIYLGADLPAADVAAAALSGGAHAVAISIVYVDDRQRVIEELRTIRDRLPAGVPIIAGGAGARVLERQLVSSGVRVVGSLAELTAELRRAAPEG